MYGGVTGKAGDRLPMSIQPGSERGHNGRLELAEHATASRDSNTEGQLMITPGRAVSLAPLDAYFRSVPPANCAPP